MTEEIDENCPKCNQHNVDLDKLYTDVYDVEGFILGGKVDCVNSYLCMDCGSLTLKLPLA